MMVEQANFIDKEHFEPYILSLYRNPENNIAARIELPEGRYVQFAFKNIYDIVSWWKLYRWMRRERFDCVLTNLFDANVIVRSLAVLVGVPCILSYEHNIYRDKKRQRSSWTGYSRSGTIASLSSAPQVKDFVVAQEKNSRRKNRGRIRCGASHFRARKGRPRRRAPEDASSGGVSLRGRRRKLHRTKGPCVSY